MRMGIELSSSDAVVVAMHNENVKNASAEAIPINRQGPAHGACKRVHYPQKSIAVLMGLGQFGVSRIVFRDEIIDDRVRRFTGPLKSIILFDQEVLTTGKKDGIFLPSEDWRNFLLHLSDFNRVDPEINQYRFYHQALPQDRVRPGTGQYHADSIPDSLYLDLRPGAEAYPFPGRSGRFNRAAASAFRHWRCAGG